MFFLVPIVHYWVIWVRITYLYIQHVNRRQIHEIYTAIRITTSRHDVALYDDVRSAASAAGTAAAVADAELRRD